MLHTCFFNIEITDKKYNADVMQKILNPKSIEAEFSMFENLCKNIEALNFQ